MNCHLLRLALLVLIHSTLLLAGGLALAQADPPGRVGRLNDAEGTVTFAPAGDNEWIDAQPNRPLTRGDRLWTDHAARAAIQVGSSTIRLNGQSRLEFLQLDDHSVQLSLLQGTASVRVRNLPEGQNFEIDTPNLAFRAATPGDYRIDVDPALGTTRVTLVSGSGAVYGEGGQAQSLGGGQQVTYRERRLTQLEARESPPQDAFDRWAADRSRREDQSIAARYVPREVVGFQQLDAHGQWMRHATHGAIWLPQGTPAGWAPYRYGRWDWIAPWGWTWIDDAPWGFAPSHYGRWLLLEDRWAWVPGRLGPRPVYAPALVAFVDAGSFLPGAARSAAVAWFPLAPGEVWQPAYRASVAYISNANRDMVPGQRDASYLYQHRREALTALSRADFHHARPAAAGWLRAAAITLTNASIVPPPPMPDRTAVARERTGAAHKAAAAKPPPPLVANAAAPHPDAAARAARTTATPGMAAPRDQMRQQASASARQNGTQVAASTAPAIAAAPARADAQPQVATAERRKASLPQRVGPVRAGNTTAQRPASDRNLRAEARTRTGLRQVPTERARQAGAQARSGTAVPTARQASINGRRDDARRARQGRDGEIHKREQLAARAAQARDEQTRRAERLRRESTAARAEQTRRQQLARQAELARHAAQALRDEQRRREAATRHDEQLRREAHAAQVQQARRAADREAHLLREQRLQREEQARRAAQQREHARREEQALTDQWRRDQEHREQQQESARRSDRRPEWRDDSRRVRPEVWQRGIPILNWGRTS